jgi:hypothetical protein
VEPDSLVYQENFARSKRFIVPLLIGAIWGWLTGPTIVPSPLANLALTQYNRTTGHLRTPESNRTKRAIEEPFFPSGLSLPTLIGFPLRFLTHLAIKAFARPSLNATIAVPPVKESTRVEREAPIEDVKSSSELEFTGIPETTNFMDFYERLQAIRYQMGLDVNQTTTSEAFPDNSTSSQISPIVNFIYLWLIIMIVCVGIFGILAIYNNAPRYLKKLQVSLMHHNGPSTKGRDMKQDFSRAIHI